MEKIKLFTHVDLDGIGCSILAQKTFGKENVDVEYCDYNNINQKVEEFYIGNDKFNYDRVYIIDISVNEEVAKIISHYIGVSGCPVIQLLDHHKTALWLNKKHYWAYVSTNKSDLNGKEDELTSGTELFYEYLCTTDKLRETNKNIAQLVNCITDYDTWKWKTDNNIIPKQLNDLLYLLGRERFINEWTCDIFRYTVEEFIDKYELLLELNQEKVNAYIESKNKELIKAELFDLSCGIIFAEQYISELGNKLCEMNPDIEFVAIVNPSHSVSYRTTKEYLDLSELAKNLNGGGHSKSAGSPLTLRDKKDILKDIFGWVYLNIE